MVNIVDSSFDYRETNVELAKENGELRQQLAFARDENYNNRAELHRKDVELYRKEVELIELREDLLRINNEVKNIILRLPNGKDCRKSVASVATNSESLLALPEPIETNNLYKDSNNKQDVDNNINSDKYQEELIDNNNLFDDNGTLAKIIEEDEENKEEDEEDVSNQSVNDSLDPPNVTSVPPLGPERVIHTPSIWKCLDLTNDDMFQSTPVRISTAGSKRKSLSVAENQENIQNKSQAQQQLELDQHEKSVKDKEPIKKRQPAKRKATGKAEVTSENAPRYNLRKRSKV